MTVSNELFQSHQRSITTLKGRRDAILRQLNELEVDAAIVYDSIQTTALDADHPTMASALDDLARTADTLENQANAARHELEG